MPFRAFLKRFGPAKEADTMVYNDYARLFPEGRQKSLESFTTTTAWNGTSMKLCDPVSSTSIRVQETKYSMASKEENLTVTDRNQNSYKPPKSKNLVLALLYGLLSGLFFAACAASVKYLTDLDPGQVAFYQYIAIALFSLPMVVKAKESIFGPPGSTRYWIILCGVFDAITVYLAFVSFRYLPLSDATVLTSSVPVFVTISARIFLKEKCSSFQVFAICISVLGIALVSKVPLLLAHRTDVYTRESVIGLLASLGSIATESGVYVILRKLHNVNVFVILFNFGIVATAVNAGLTAGFGQFSWSMCGIQQWLVIAVGVFSFLSQLTLTKALELEEAGPVSVLMAAGDIILAFILDMTLFNDTPDMYTIGGTILVVSSVVLVGFKKWLESNAKGRSLKIKLLKYFR